MARRFLLSARQTVLTVAAVLSLTLASPLAVAPAFAQDVPPEVENSKNAAVGEINADSVYVRSGAGDNYYPTMKLNKGARVTVVGAKFGWLKILPPEGSFCYVAKAYLDKGAGEMAQANRPDTNVRAGSVLNAMKTTVQAKLEQGQQVKVLGEQEDYYKIAPPPDAYVYVKKEFVDPVQAIPQVAGKGNGGDTASPQQPAPQDDVAPQQPIADVPTQTTPDAPSGDAVAGAPTTRPSEKFAAAPSTQPSPDQVFDQLEADFGVASSKPIEQQPIAELQGRYQKLIDNPQLPESMRRIADYRSQTLKARAEAREQFVAVQKEQEAARQRLQAARAEQEELAQQIQKNDVKIFTAVGTLRTSSLQQGGEMLYRLTDPQTGRTVCYLRSNDPSYASLLEKFVGVRGEVTTDPALSLRVITPTDATETDPNQLYRSVAATIVPPSLLPQGAQAASGQE